MSNTDYVNFELKTIPGYRKSSHVIHYINSSAGSPEKITSTWTKKEVGFHENKPKYIEVTIDDSTGSINKYKCEYKRGIPGTVFIM